MKLILNGLYYSLYILCFTLIALGKYFLAILSIAIAVGIRVADVRLKLTKPHRKPTFKNKDYGLTSKIAIVNMPSGIISLRFEFHQIKSARNILSAF